MIDIFCILNAFHCAFLAFWFQVSKTQLFLLRLRVGFVDLKIFVANFEVECFGIIASRLRHVLMVYTNHVSSYLAYSAFFSDHKSGLLLVNIQC